MNDASPPAVLAEPAHVFVWRTYRGVPFQHHGVAMGDGTVVHFTDGQGGIARPGRGAENFRVCQTPWIQFSPEGIAMIHRVPHSAPLAPERIRRRAARMVGRGRYDLVTNNCEHFACWCVTGQFESRQVGIAIERAAAAAAKATVSAAARVGVRSALSLTRSAVMLRRAANPAMLVPDAAQWATEAVGHHVGLRDPKKRRAAGRTVGATTAALVGLPGGPLGVLAATALWAIGESAARAAEQATARRSKMPRSAERQQPPRSHAPPDLSFPGAAVLPSAAGAIKPPSEVATTPRRHAAEDEQSFHPDAALPEPENSSFENASLPPTPR